MRETELTAVKAGKHFNVFQKKELDGITLSKTCLRIRLNGKTYDLWHGKTLEDSRKILRLLKARGGIQTKDYTV